MIINKKSLSVKQNNTTFRFSSLVYGLYANHCFFDTFFDTTTHAYKYKFQTAIKKWSADGEKLHFCWLVISIPMYLKKQRLSCCLGLVLFCYADKKSPGSQFITRNCLVVKLNNNILNKLLEWVERRSFFFFFFFLLKFNKMTNQNFWEFRF